MVWLISVLNGLLAVGVWILVTPRVRVRSSDGQAAPPDFAALPGARNTVGLFIGTVVVSQCLHLVPIVEWWLWIPYLSVGAPLVLVDALTTWLPLQLHLLATTAMGVALIGLVIGSWRAAAAAVLGGAAAFGLFLLVRLIGRAIAFGDVRLAGLVGMVSGQAGYGNWIVALMVGTSIGAVWGIARAVLRRYRVDRSQHFAYGPALWLGPSVAVVVTSAWW